MSVLKQLYEFLLQYQGIEILNDIDGNEEMCALFPYGDCEVNEYNDGSIQFTKRFLMMFRKGTPAESNGEDSYSWIGDFFDWVEQQAYNYNFPNLGSDVIVEDLTISNLQIPDNKEELLAGTYTAQLKIVYTKEA